MTSNVIDINGRLGVATSEPEDFGATGSDLTGPPPGLSETEQRIWQLGYDQGAADERARLDEDVEFVLDRFSPHHRKAASHLSLA